MSRLFLLLQAVSGTLIYTSYEGLFIPQFTVEYILSGTASERIQGFGSLDFRRGSRPLFSCDSRDSMAPPTEAVRRIRAVSMGEGFLEIDCGRDMDVLDASWSELHPTVLIGASPSSEFAQLVSGFVLYPTSHHFGHLVLNPINPEEYTYGSELFFARNMGTNFWAISMAVRLIDDVIDRPVIDSQIFSPCTIDLREKFLSVPTQIITELLNNFDQVGITVTRTMTVGDGLIYRIHALDESSMHLLPSIQFIVETIDRQYISIVSIDPDEYISSEREPDGSRQLRIASNDVIDHCAITQTVFRKIVIHFDTENNQMGFGEPLVEL